MCHHKTAFSLKTETFSLVKGILQFTTERGLLKALREYFYAAVIFVVLLLCDVIRQWKAAVLLSYNLLVLLLFIH